MSELIIGKEYRVEHTRKGTFVILVHAQDEESVTGMITDGSARMVNGDDQGPGESITVRRRLCRLTLINND